MRKATFPLPITTTRSERNIATRAARLLSVMASASLFAMPMVALGAPGQGDTSSTALATAPQVNTPDVKVFTFPAVSLVGPYGTAYALSNVIITLTKNPATKSIDTSVRYVEEGNTYGGWDSTPRDFPVQIYHGQALLQELHGPQWTIGCHQQNGVVGSLQPSILYDNFDLIDYMILPPMHGHTAGC